MKTARILLAALSLATLAACGTETITEPAIRAPGSARHDLTPPDGDGTANGDTGTGGTCKGVLSITVDPNGLVVQTCVLDDRGPGPFVGSGG